MIEIRPKFNSEEEKMIHCAETLKDFCTNKQGSKACLGCLFHEDGVGCRLNCSMPEDWKVGEGYEVRRM